MATVKLKHGWVNTPHVCTIEEIIPEKVIVHTSDGKEHMSELTLRETLRLIERADRNIKFSEITKNIFANPAQVVSINTGRPGQGTLYLTNKRDVSGNISGVLRALDSSLTK